MYEDETPDLNAERRSLRERGASLLEYSLLVALIAVVCLSALRSFGGANQGSIEGSTSRIVNAMDGTSPP